MFDLTTALALNLETQMPDPGIPEDQLMAMFGVTPEDSSDA